MSRVRSWLAAPLGARLLGVALALAGVALLVLGVLAFGASDDNGPGAAPGPSTAAPTVAPTVAPTSAPSTSPAPSPTAAPSAPATTSQLPSTGTPSAPGTGTPGTGTPAPTRGALTVLNNSTIRGLGERAAAQARDKGWTVASVGNFAGVIPVSTVYFTPGNAAEQAAAEQLAVDLPQVDRVMPRYDGLPPTPTGIVLVVTRDW